MNHSHLAPLHLPNSTKHWQSFKKVELHRHLELSIDLTTFMRYAPQIGIDLSASAESTLQNYFITQPMQNLSSVLHAFLSMQKFWQTPALIEELTFVCCQNAIREGIEAVEFRYAPSFIQGACPDLSYLEIHSAVLRGLKRGQSLGLKAGLIGIVQRILPYKKAEEMMDFFIAHKDSFVGVDLADSEVGYDCKVFAPLFLQAKQAGLGITVHSGEENVPEAPQFVLDAIRHLGAERIGHGLQIIHDKKVMDVVKQEKIVLEICPTSNWLTQAVSDITHHPVRKLFDYGILLCINTDDPGIFHIDLNHEYETLHHYHGFTPEELQACNEVAHKASFLLNSNKT